MTDAEKNAAAAEDDRLYRVVVNHQEQYSIWPADRRQVPVGWKFTGFEGTKGECLDHIQEVWTDMRPPSCRTPSVRYPDPP